MVKGVERRPALGVERRKGRNRPTERRGTWGRGGRGK